MNVSVSTLMEKGSRLKLLEDSRERKPTGLVVCTLAAWAWILADREGYLLSRGRAILLSPGRIYNLLSSRKTLAINRLGELVRGEYPTTQDRDIIEKNTLQPGATIFF